MRRRWLTLLIALIALATALIASGCGKSKSSSALDDELAFVPKTAPVVVAVKTDPNDQQYKQLGKLIGRLPFGGPIKSGFEQRLAASGRPAALRKGGKP